MDAARIRKGFGLALYRAFGRLFPVTYRRPFGPLGKRFRGWCAGLMLDECGRDVTVERGAVFSTRCTLGDRSGIGEGALLDGRVVIGNDVMMGPGCTIYCQNHRFDRTDIPMCQQGMQAERPVIVEDDVWLGAHTILLPGVRVGHGAIVGAGAVVREDVPPLAIVAGNPAQVLGYRDGRGNAGD